MGFCHLQVKSTYSILRSNIEIDALVQKAKQLGFQSLALTDFHAMYGVIHFYEACIKEKIHPIIGLTVSYRFEELHGQFIFLAKNMIGYQQLVKISSHLQVTESGFLTMDVLDCLSKGQPNQDLIVILPGQDSVLYPLLQKGFQAQADSVYQQLKKQFSHMYIGLHKPSEVHIYRLLNVQPEYVVLNDVCFLTEHEAEVIPYLQAIAQGEKFSDIVSDPFLKEKYLKSEEEIRAIFSENEEWVQKSVEIAKLCQLQFEFPLVSLPVYPLPEKLVGRITSFEYLSKLCFKGAEKRYQEITPEIMMRLQYELNVIHQMCFENYFLIVWDFMKYARTHGILTGPGRGSAAGSLVAYVLGITDVDPLAYHLLFERFLNPERLTMPDIDLDFPDNKRDDVIQYVKEKYGDRYIAQIVTFGTFGAKQAIRDIGRVMGYTPKELDEISRRIPSKLGITLDAAYQESISFRKIIDQTPKAQKLFTMAQKIEGLPRHTSVHAAGVIISPIAFGEMVPVQAGTNQTLVTQYPADVLERLGFLKMDFLGLRNLKLIQEILDDVQRNKGITLDIRKIPLNDQKTYEIFRQGETNGIFQFESEGMRRALRKLQPTEFNDLVALNALYRPGPMEQIPRYIENKQKQIRDVLHIEAIHHVLDSTYGIIVYQEQIMQIAHIMAGFSLAEADLLRRAIGKKEKSILDYERTRFIEGARKKGYSEQIGNQVYDLIVQFANYGFNKSHSVAYSMIAYQLAYLKANYPLEFFVAALSNVMGTSSKTQVYLKEARANGIEIYPPSVLSGSYRFSFGKQGIILGLGNIKGIGKQSAHQIIKERKKQPFIDFFDFVSRMTLSGYNQKMFETLILSGALDEFGLDRAVLLENLDAALRYTELIQPFIQGEQMNLFQLSQLVPKPRLKKETKMTDEEKGKHEKALLGFYLTANPYKKLTKFALDSRFILLKELKYTSKYLKKLTAVMIQAIRHIRTKHGEPMAFLTVEDASGVFEAVVFPKTYAVVSLQLQQGNFVILQCSTDFKNEKIQYLVHECWPLEMFEAAYHRGDFQLYIQLDSPDVWCDQLLTICKADPGNTQIVLFEKEKRQMSQSFRQRIDLNDESIQRLIQLFGEENLAIKK